MKRTLGMLGAIAATAFLGRPVSSDGPGQPSAGAEVIAAIGQSTGDSGFDWEHVTKSCGVLNAAYPSHDLNIKDGYSAEAVVALVPDPAKTNLQLFFDRTLESLVWGVGDSGYTLECHSLPWPSAEPAEAPLKLFGNEQLYKSVERADSKFPGVVVFRSKQDSRKLMLLLLVGETPTGGVSHDQFEMAMQWLPASTANVRLVGPTFSGTFRSLVDVMGPTTRTFTIRSGSATSTKARQGFQREIAMLKPPSDFKALAHDDNFAQAALMRYVRQEARESGPIAILSEDDTVYGNVEASGVGNYLPLRFPREIAHLRNAYRSTVAPSKETALAPKHLPLKLESGRLGTDFIPSYSQDQTPISNDAVLLGIASTLRREGVRYAGIVATDALDVAFLCRYLREAVPNVRLIVFSSDLLLLHEQESASMAGTLAVSTYPLFSRNQHWTDEQLASPSPRRILFADGYSEGTYNATKSLLNGPEERLLEYEAPVPPHTSGRPPLWLTEVGKEAWWPVAVLSQDERIRPDGMMLKWHPSTARADEAFHPERPSSLFRILFALTAGLSLLHLYMIQFRYLTRWPAGSDGLARLLPTYPERDPNKACTLALLMLSLVLAAANCLLGIPLLRFTECNDWVFTTAGAAACLLSLLLAASAVALQKFHMKCAARKVDVLVAALVLFALAWIFLNWNWRENAGLFFAYRNLFPTSGVSPVMPLLVLLTALLHFCWVHLTRVASIAMYGIASPSVGCFRLIREFARGVSGALRLRAGVRWKEMAGAVTIWLVCTWPGWSLWTSDHWVYSVLTVLMFSLVAAAMAVTFFQFQRLWARFRGYLEQLEKQPFREAFSRLPKEFAGPVWKAIPREHVLLISSRCRDSLAAFLSDTQASAALVSYGPGRLLRIRSAITRIEGQVLRQSRPDSVVYGVLQTDLSDTADQLIRWLDKEWKKGASDSLTLSEEKPKAFSDADKTRLYAEEFLAFRCLVVIRHTMRNLRNLLTFLIVGFVLFVLAMEAYPYQAPRSLGFESVTIFLLLGFFIGRSLAQMDRNPVLSRLSNSKPHELSGEFGWRLITAGALPLITILGSQFPVIGNWLSSWLEPAMKALK